MSVSALLSNTSVIFQGSCLPKQHLIWCWDVNEFDLAHKQFEMKLPSSAPEIKAVSDQGCAPPIKSARASVVRGRPISSNRLTALMVICLVGDDG
jgi:hypothetical protein